MSAVCARKEKQMVQLRVNFNILHKFGDSIIFGNTND